MNRHITEKEKKRLVFSFWEKHRKLHLEKPNYVHEDIEHMEKFLKIPMVTPTENEDNVFFIKEQKASLNTSPAIAIDWVAVLVSHIKKVTNNDNPRILQIHGDNVFFSNALKQCSIDNVAYQQRRFEFLKKNHQIPYKKEKAALKKHKDSVDAVVILVPVIQEKYLNFINKNKKILKKK